MGIKDFFVKQMLKSKMKGVPEAQQQQMLELVEKNPDFFKKVGDLVDQKKKQGKTEMEATFEVMREHQAEFQKLMQK
jgi:hypothetical protein